MDITTNCIYFLLLNPNININGARILNLLSIFRKNCIDLKQTLLNTLRNKNDTTVYITINNRR